jgi:hypothetical protein
MEKPLACNIINHRYITFSTKVQCLAVGCHAVTSYEGKQDVRIVLGYTVMSSLKNCTKLQRHITSKQLVWAYNFAARIRRKISS